MNKRLLALSLPIGIFIEIIYFTVNYFIQIPDIIVYPMMIISIILMLIGVGFYSYCFVKHKSPYDFK